MHDADILRAAASILHDHSDIVKPCEGADPAEIRAQADELERVSVQHGDPIPCTGGLFTRREAEWARNRGIALLMGERGLGLGERDTDLLGLASAVAAEAIDNPAVTLDEVIAARYNDTPAKVRSWWTGWS